MNALRDSQEERATKGAQPRDILSAHEMAIRYGRQTVVENVTFSVRPGSVYALLGRNGAGKSSMIRCLLGQQRPQAGSVRILGVDAWRRRAQAMERTGVVPERPDAPPALNPSQLAKLFAARNRGLFPDGHGQRQFLTGADGYFETSGLFRRR